MRDHELDDAVEDALQEAWSPQARASSILARRGRRTSVFGSRPTAIAKPKVPGAPKAPTVPKPPQAAAPKAPKAPAVPVPRAKPSTRPYTAPKAPTAASYRPTGSKSPTSTDFGKPSRPRGSKSPTSTDFGKPPTLRGSKSPTSSSFRKKRAKTGGGERPEEHPGHHEYERIRSGMRRDERDTLDREYSKAKKEGFKGKRSKFLGQQFRKYQTEEEGSPNAPRITLYADSYDKLEKIHTKPKKKRTREATAYDGMDTAIDALLRESDAAVYGTDDYDAIVGELREFNTCHATTTGRFCSGGGINAVGPQRSGKSDVYGGVKPQTLSDELGMYALGHQSAKRIGQRRQRAKREHQLALKRLEAEIDVIRSKRRGR